ncbi:MAG: DUF6984 family protein [Halanaerobiales bacterium]
MLRKLRANELKWIKYMFDKEFPEKKVLQEQIKESYIKPNYNNNFISLKFYITSDLKKFTYTNIRVPVEMRVYERDNDVPIIFILHVIEGFINELEIYKADSSEIIDKFSFDGLEIIINSELKNRMI